MSEGRKRPAAYVQSIEESTYRLKTLFFLLTLIFRFHQEGYIINSNKNFRCVHWLVCWPNPAKGIVKPGELHYSIS